MNNKRGKNLVLFDIDNTLINDIDTIRMIFHRRISPKEDDLIEILEKLNKKYVLGIWSQGFRKIQIHKLKAAGIFKYFDSNQIWISLNKTGLLNEINSQDYKKIFIIDDKDFEATVKKYPKIILTKVEKLAGVMF